MFWNTIPSAERLHLWKSLRTDIQELALEAQLKKVAEFCSKIPYGARTIDYYTPESWPTPWEILYNGIFCTSSISLLMFYTLSLIPNFKDKIALILVNDGTDIFLLPLVNDKYILNYILGSVVEIDNFKDNLKIINTFTPDKIKKVN
jgi:hypothetical protein